jgi:GT2 family glycosyltransferase
MLGIVLISYKNVEEVIHYVLVELTKIKSLVKIIIVDNSCDDNNFKYLIEGLSAEVPAEFINPDKRIFAIKASSNLGYAKANNIGAKFLIDNFKIDYILFSNTDIKFIDSDVVDVLLSKIKIIKKQEIGFISPKITGIDNRDQVPAFYLPFYKSCIFKYLFYPIVKVFKFNFLADDIIVDAKEGYYYRLSGSFMLASAKVLNTINFFDENTFLYGEELIIAEKLKKYNYRNYYFPNVKILHNESQTVSKFHSKRKTIVTSFNSKIYFYKNYMNVSKGLILISHISFFIYLNIYRNVFILFKRVF